MQTRLRQLLILLLSLWLPLQGLAGALSPQCAHHANLANAAAADHESLQHGAHHHGADVTQQQAQPETGPAHCDHCDPCHLGANFLPTPSLIATATPPESFGAVAAITGLPPVFLDGPQRPPQSSLT